MVRNQSSPSSAIAVANAQQDPIKHSFIFVQATHTISAAFLASNKVVAIKANINGKYVTAENAGASALIANRTTAQAWERFDQIDLGNGKSPTKTTRSAGKRLP